MILVYLASLANCSLMNVGLCVFTTNGSVPLLCTLESNPANASAPVIHNEMINAINQNKCMNFKMS